MQIKNLSLTNFRSYKKREFVFSPRTNLIVGRNTTGKTNLLEAIFLLSSGTSPQAVLDREMIKEGEELAFVIGGIIDGSVAKELEVQLIASKNFPTFERQRKSGVEVKAEARTVTTKKFKINGVAKRLGDFLPEFHVVLFSPEDLNLVAGSPDLRRRFLDLALSNVEFRYRYAATEYEKVRKRRNRLLERINVGEAKESELSFWDAKLLEFGTFIQDERKKFFNEINTLITSHFSLNYLISGLTAERLYEYRSREIAAETTLIGPHRDDFSFLLINQSTNQPVNLSTFGSRSEQRRAVLALKKAELEFVERKISDRPVLLLDDIFSELDEENRARVSSLLNEGQVIITTADLHHIPTELQKDLRVIKL
ncbi:hypothetical protein CO059_01460 [candidate division WWE3 bacterium CG_4_9_14_0_2_um_filter_48_10]|uniref:DNA replication and repair protein RecF n=1 Tax=candidate division WWE3 bacterium CG_4_9_14_0_2_um_filter_48_10 TaxID=1975078 RepID=A0A2M8EJF6_UNCKA|nr:MAG: hypothetical protein CO059_01460 [candidate division WWE3 bacterium CG_4_9_14_0_2_um_filter_48_10]